MKHKCFAAVVLAAALWLAGCGGAAAPAAPAGPSAASQSAAAAAVQTAQKERITDQYTLEKNISGVWEADTGQYISGNMRPTRRPDSRAVSTRRSV